MACEEQAFVRRAYWVLLGREPDAGGLVNYLGRLHSGTSKQQILAELARSPEGRTHDVAVFESAGAGVAAEPPAARAAPLAGTWDELVAGHGRVFLNCAYHTLLGREIDADGLRFYQARLQAGSSKSRVLCALRYSGEHRARARLLRQLRRALPDAPRLAEAPETQTRAGANDDPGAAPTLSDVLGYSDSHLVSFLCSLALGSGAGDSQAYRDAMERLQTGTPLRQLLGTIMKSPAGRRRRALLRRLDREIVKYFLARIPVLGRVIAAAFGIDGDTPFEMRLRRIEYRVLGTGEETQPGGEWRAPAGGTDVSAAGARAPGPAADRGVRPAPRLIASREPSETTAAVASLRSMPAPADWGDQ